MLRCFGPPSGSGEEGSFCGPEIAQNATYTWKMAGDRLVLKATADPCADRDSTLAGTWATRP